MRPLRRQRGQTLVEFALTIMVFLLFVMGVFDLGRGILYYNMLSNAAREGARYGIISTRSADAICAVAIAATQLPNVPAASACGTTGALTVNAIPGTPPAADGSPGNPVQVTMAYSFTLVTPLIGNIVGNSLTLSASSTMYVEN